MQQTCLQYNTWQMEEKILVYVLRYVQATLRSYVKNHFA